MSRSSRAAHALTWALLFAAGGAAAQASTTLNTAVSAGAFGILDESVIGGSTDAAQSRSDSASFFSPFPTAPGNGGAAVYGMADFGVLKAAAVASCVGGCGANGHVAAGFADVLVIDRPDLHGQTGFITSRIAFSWSGTAGNHEVTAEGVRFASYGQAGASLLLSGLGSFQASELAVAGGLGQAPRLQVSDASGSLQDIPFAWEVEVRTPFAFGNPLPFSMWISVDAYAAGAYGPDGHGSLEASASLEASHSSYWGGLSVALSDGTVVNEYDLRSDSGVDWRSSFIPPAVPEPDSAMLLAIGLLALTAGPRFRSLSRKRQRNH